MSKILKTNHASSRGGIVKIPNKKKGYTIDILNPHCFANIFRYLSIEERLNLEKVSEKCKHCCKFAWRDTRKLDLGDSLPDDESLPGQAIIRQALTRCGEYLTELSLGSKFDCRILTAVTKHCHNLVTLKLQLSNKFNKNFDWTEDTLSGMINLKSIELFNCQDRYSLVLSHLPDDIEKVTFANGFHNSKFLSNDNDIILTRNIARWKNLKSLVLRNWEIDMDLIASITQRETLTHLCLDRCIVLFGDEAQQHLSMPFLQNLQYLNLYSVEGISQDYLTGIVTNCKKLTHLNLEQMRPYQYAVLYEIKNLTNLEYLNVAYLTGVDDAVINNIVMNCNKLKHLNISHCSEITKEALEKLTRMTNLKELVMNGTQVDDSILLQLKDMKIVECGGLLDNESVTTVGVLGIIQSSLETLQRLNVSSTKFTTEEIDYIRCIAINRENNAELILILKPLLVYKLESGKMRQIASSNYHNMLW